MLAAQPSYGEQASDNKPWRKERKTGKFIKALIFSLSQSRFAQQFSREREPIKFSSFADGGAPAVTCVTSPDTVEVTLVKGKRKISESFSVFAYYLESDEKNTNPPRGGALPDRRKNFICRTLYGPVGCGYSALLLKNRLLYDILNSNTEFKYVYHKRGRL